jgi:hypothetical protein
MKKCSVIVLVALVMVRLACAQYWLQSGVSGSGDSANNYGASVSIQSIYQNITDGSLGFWVGENLENDAFVQVGYEIVNQSAEYPTSCTPSGCTGETHITAGVPTWFWEYFPPGSAENAFYGGVGGDGSAGANGTFNTYAFQSAGSSWNFYFNNEKIGSVDLGTSGSGQNSPSAMAEVADTNTNMFVMKVVKFKNLEFYNGNSYMLLPSAYSQISYGSGSDTAMPNMYGVQEINHAIDYFEVGSGLPTHDGSLMWQFGYTLEIVSPYGNLPGSGNYSAYVPVSISAPLIINLSNSTREVFVGWKGQGAGSYSGNESNATVMMDSNIEETALWQRQYYLAVNGTYDSVSGAGWYNAGNAAVLRVTNKTIYIANGTRLMFAGWSNGAGTNQTAVIMSAPENITALWKLQYFVDVSAPYGSTFGTGWYVNGSMTEVSLSGGAVSTGNESRLAFVRWNNGNANTSVQILVDRPIALDAQFEQQYLVRFAPEDTYGSAVGGVEYYNISSNRVYNSSAFLFVNRSYNVEYAYYKNTQITVDYAFVVNEPETISIKIPLYNVVISAKSMFGTPVNATVDATFKNGTSVSLYTGAKGILRLQDVPYGYVTGDVKYFGLAEDINLLDGSVATLTFITPSLVIAIIAGIAIIVIASRASIYYRDHFMKKGQSAE